MYSQQGQGERPRLCKDCNNNNVQTIVKWVPNPEKPGVNPYTNKPYMIPWDVNKNARHDCQFFKARTAQGPATQTTRFTGEGGPVVVPKPQFTANDQTAKDILAELKTLVKQNEEIKNLLEIVAGEKAAEAMRKGGIGDRTGHVNLDEEYQNRTAYSDSNTDRDRVNNPEPLGERGWPE